MKTKDLATFIEEIRNRKLHFFCCYLTQFILELLNSLLQLGYKLKSVCPHTHPSVWSNYSNICLHTIYSGYPPLWECFKIKKSLTCFGQKSIACPKNLCSVCVLSPVVSHTVGKPMKKRSQKVQKKLMAPYPLPAAPKNRFLAQK